MKHVWTTLRSRDRKTGSFRYPARLPASAPCLAPEAAQDDALARTLYFVYRSATDQRRVSKADDLAPLIAARLAKAQALRDVAAELRSAVRLRPDLAIPQHSADAEALERVAAWHDRQTATIRGPADPLTITNDRGDPVVRAVQADIAGQLYDLFGDRLDGTAATLAAVALGVTTSPRVSRSAFSRPKGARKS
ncbi:hypothetical protein [Acidisphaera rubrifaciens]|uniref:hypothetical protein n=1 Tax=Acidisphaera rubrifaciens TaxID=50715 RepID=UPI0011DC83DA|nr:hypothetical protein [Acidisphaera rubrifaciens]